MRASIIQAWEWSDGAHGGYVYNQRAALDRVSDGCDVQAVTIVRHGDGSREYLRGVLAREYLRAHASA